MSAPVPRPEWVELIVQEWGEPAMDQGRPFKAHGVHPTGRREVRITRMWGWDRGGAFYGVRVWNTSPLLSDCRIVIDVTGPVGAVSYSRPGDTMPYASIASVLELAGIPPFGADLTSRQPVTYAQDSTANPDEGEHVSEIESTEAAEVETDAAEQAPADAAETTDTSDEQ